MLALMLVGCGTAVTAPEGDAGPIGDASAVVPDGADGGCWIDSGGHYMDCNDGALRCYYQPGVATCPGEWSCVSAAGVESCLPR